MDEKGDRTDVKTDVLDLTATSVLHDTYTPTIGRDIRPSFQDVVTLTVAGVPLAVFTDWNRQKLKSVYRKGKRNCSKELKVSSNPKCIATLTESKVAVSLPVSQHIITVAVTPDLELLSTIKTSKKYWGLSVLDQSTLVVGSCSPTASVDLINMEGIILKSFTNLPGIESFSHPTYVHVTGSDNILVSDHVLNAIICVTETGDAVFTYKPTGERELVSPYGITSTSTGDILVAGTRINKVVHLSESGEFIREILTRENGLDWPTGLCVDGDTLCVLNQEKGLRKYRFVN